MDRVNNNNNNTFHNVEHGEHISDVDEAPSRHTHTALGVKCTSSSYLLSRRASSKQAGGGGRGSLRRRLGESFRVEFCIMWHVCVTVLARPSRGDATCLCKLEWMLNECARERARLTRAHNRNKDSIHHIYV